MTVTHSLVPTVCQGPTHRRTGDASDLTAGTEQSRQREVEVGRRWELKPRSCSRKVEAMGRRSCTWSPCATQHTGGTTQTTPERMRPQGISAHENEFLEFSFAPAKGIEWKDPE